MKTEKDINKSFKEKHGHTIEQARFVLDNAQPTKKVKCISCEHNEGGSAYCNAYKKKRLDAYFNELKPKGKSLYSCPRYKKENK